MCEAVCVKILILQMRGGKWQQDGHGDNVASVSRAWSWHWPLWEHQSGVRTPWHSEVFTKLNSWWKLFLLILYVRKNASKQVTAKSWNANIFLFANLLEKKVANVVYILHGFLFTNGRVIIALVRVMNFLLMIFVTISIKSISQGKKQENNIFVSLIHQTSKVGGWFHCSVTNSLKCIQYF